MERSVAVLVVAFGTKLRQLSERNPSRVMYSLTDVAFAIATVFVPETGGNGE